MAYTYGTQQAMQGATNYKQPTQQAPAPAAQPAIAPAATPAGAGSLGQLATNFATAPAPMPAMQNPAMPAQTPAGTPIVPDPVGGNPSTIHGGQHPYKTFQGDPQALPAPAAPVGPAADTLEGLKARWLGYHQGDMEEMIARKGQERGWDRKVEKNYRNLDKLWNKMSKKGFTNINDYAASREKHPGTGRAHYDKGLIRLNRIGGFNDLHPRQETSGHGGHAQRRGHEGNWWEWQPAALPPGPGDPTVENPEHHHPWKAFDGPDTMYNGGI